MGLQFIFSKFEIEHIFGAERNNISPFSKVYDFILFFINLYFSFNKFDSSHISKFGSFIGPVYFVYAVNALLTIANICFVLVSYVNLISISN